MKMQAGVWIDYRKAVIVTLANGVEAFEQILSNVDRQRQRAGDSPLKGDYESLQVPADDRQKNAFIEHLGTYYDAVIAKLRLAESILLFGPAEAKDELRKRLARSLLGKHVVGIETEDKMTNRQIVAKVRSYFLPEGDKR